MEGQQQLVGGEVHLDDNVTKLTDSLARQALSDVTDRYNKMVNSMYRAIPVGGEVTRQTVNGIMFRFKEVQFATTTSRNNAASMGLFTAEDCPLNQNNNTVHKRVNADVYWDREKMTINNFDLID